MTPKLIIPGVLVGEFLMATNRFMLVDGHQHVDMREHNGGCISFELLSRYDDCGEQFAVKKADVHKKYIKRSDLEQG